MERSAEPLARVLHLLKAHGWNSTSFQVLEPGFRYWFQGAGASRRWHPRLADALAVAVTLDAALTLVQAIAFDMPRHPTAVGGVVIAIAVLAPSSAAALLWSGRAHRRLRLVL